MPQPMRWRILADDLTGALDTAAAWCSAMTSVPVFLDRPHHSEAPVQAVSTGSRDLPAGDWPAALAASSLDWLCGGDRAYKKIDSLLRGNTLAELAWLLHQGRFRGAVLAPAFPAQGRFTAQQRHWVGPANQPGHAALQIVVDNLAQALAAHGIFTRSGLDMPTPEPGVPTVWVPDALHDTDLARLADLAHSPAGAQWLWCGSAGLAQALTSREDGSPRALTPTPECLITASRHPVLRGQLQCLQHIRPTAPVTDWMEPEPLAVAAATQALLGRVQAWVDSHPVPSTLAVVGGDTLLALCRCTGASALRAGPSPRPGWGQAHLVDGRWQDTLILTRSGAFGDADDLLALWPQTHLETSP
ncbi:MAG: four-carbon acid sugar kinase family protein [Hydrogenophaga sp.]|nr:four-carbon acid sugar kinase family protein [Hydrogenophaga sp.]